MLGRKHHNSDRAARDMRQERDEPEMISVTRDEWENLKTDLRTAKLLNVLSAEKIGAVEERHTQQSIRFAEVIDTLDARVGTLIRSVSAMMSRIDDDRARIGVLEERGLKDHAALLLLKTNLDVARARISVLSAIAYEATGENIDGGVLSSEKYTAKIDPREAQQARTPTLSEVIADAPEPDVEAMRRFYAGKEAERLGLAGANQQAEAAEADPSAADAATAPGGGADERPPPPSGVQLGNGEDRQQVQS